MDKNKHNTFRKMKTQFYRTKPSVVKVIESEDVYEITHPNGKIEKLTKNELKERYEKVI
tara:strand:- start:137 stop:313 length:177 start_codon:yes stop_codon:yes gene_type:complete